MFATSNRPEKTPESIRRNLAVLRTPHLHIDDDFNLLSAWIQQWKIDMRTFAKHMPHTTRDLRERKVSAADVSSEIMDILNTIEVEFPRETNVTPPDQETTYPKLIAETSTDALRFIIPKRWMRSTEQESELMLDLITTFHALFAERFPTRSKREGFLDRLLQALYTTVQEVCQTWASRFDEHFFQGKSGAFLAKSPAVNVTLDQFIKMMTTVRNEQCITQKDHNEKMLDAFQEELEVAIQYIQDGVFEAAETCWECDTCTQDLHKCGKCKVALYCGRDCQIKAWKGGHKKMCNELRHRHAKLEQQFKIVDDAHFKGFLHGFRLQCEMDYHVAQEIVFADELSVLTDDGLDDDLSMQTYYENLGRIFKGEWWLLSETDPSSMQFLDDENAHSLGVLFCHDYFKSAAQMGVTDPQEVTKLFQEAVCKRMKREWLDTKMTPRWFTVSYENREFGPYVNPANVRQQKKDLAFKRLRDEYHIFEDW